MERLGQAILFLGLTALMYTGVFVVITRFGPDGKPVIHSMDEYYKPPGGSSWYRYREFDPTRKWDVVILGSSHAIRGYDPAVFAEHGYRAFNLGSVSQTPLNSYVLLEHLVDSSTTRLLILDAFDKTFRNDGLESTVDLIANLPSTGIALDMAWELHDLRGLNVLMYRLLKPRTTTIAKDRDYTGLGFGSRPDSAKTPFDPAMDEQYVLTDRQKHFFKDIIALCKQRGISLVVTSHYARHGRNRAFHVPFVNFVDSALAGTGYPYLDYTFEPGVDDLNNFVDDNHLNIAGAKIFTGHLVDTLEGGSKNLLTT